MADAPAPPTSKKQTQRSSNKNKAPAVPPGPESSSHNDEEEPDDLRTLVLQLIEAQKQQAAQISQMTEAALNQVNHPARSIEPQLSPLPRRTTASASPEPDEERPRRDRNPKLQTLSDGITHGPSLDAWLLQIEGEIDDYPQHYPNLKHQLRLMLRFSETPAQDHLMARMKRTSRRPFTSLDDAIDTLCNALGKANEEADADHEYQELSMETYESYAVFITDFLLKADEANIAKSVRRRDLWSKITTKLQMAQAPTKSLYKDFDSLSQALHDTDREMRWAGERIRQARAARSVASSPAKPSGKLPRASGGRFSPPPEHTSTPVITERQRSKTPATATDPSKIQCYNCGKHGHMVKACPEPRKAGAELKELYGLDWEEPESEEDPVSENE